jgi:hypothetical protein
VLDFINRWVEVAQHSPPVSCVQVPENLDREIELSLRHAAECRARAKRVRNRNAQQDYLDLERRWRALASGYELAEKLAADSSQNVSSRPNPTVLVIYGAAEKSAPTPPPRRRRSSPP